MTTGIVEYDTAAAHASQVEWARALGQEIGRILSEYHAQVLAPIQAELVAPLQAELARAIRFDSAVISDMAAFRQNRDQLEQDVMSQYGDLEFLCFVLDPRGQPVTLLLNCRYGRLIRRLDETAWKSY